MFIFQLINAEYGKTYSHILKVKKMIRIEIKYGKEITGKEHVSDE